MGHQIEKTSDVKLFIENEQTELDKNNKFLCDSEHMLRIYETDISNILSKYDIILSKIEHNVVTKSSIGVESLISYITLTNPMNDINCKMIYKEIELIGIPIMKIKNDPLFHIAIILYNEI